MLGKSSRMPFAGLCRMLPSLLSHQATTTDTIRIAHLCGCINFECRSYNSPPILVTIVCWVMAVSSFRNLVEPHHPVYGAPTPRPAVPRLAATGRVARGPSPLACNLLLAPSVAIARALGGCVPVTVARGLGRARRLPLPPPLPPQPNRTALPPAQPALSPAPPRSPPTPARSLPRPGPPPHPRPAPLPPPPRPSTSTVASPKIT